MATGRTSSVLAPSTLRGWARPEAEFCPTWSHRRTRLATSHMELDYGLSLEPCTCDGAVESVRHVASSGLACRVRNQRYRRQGVRVGR